MPKEKIKNGVMGRTTYNTTHYRVDCGNYYEIREPVPGQDTYIIVAYEFKETVEGNLRPA